MLGRLLGAMGISLILLFAVGCGDDGGAGGGNGGGNGGSAGGTGGGKGGVQNPEPDADAVAFHAARKATTAKNWDTAKILLQRIDIDKVKDVDVLEYVDFSKRCVDVAEKLGLDRGSDPLSPSDIFSKADHAQAVLKIIELIIDGDFKDAVALLRDARKIQTQIEGYFELDEKLVEKYGKE